MTDKILALVDGSVYSASVCALAGWAAKRSGAAVEVLHVLGRREAPDKQDLSGAIRLGARSALLQELADLDAQRAKLITRRGRAILEDAQGMLAAAGLTGVTTRLRHGDLVETVAEAEPETAVIVIGKRGEAADFAKGHLGSNLERIVRASHKPVMVAARAFRPIGKVLLAYDGGGSAKKAVAHVAKSPQFQGLSVEVIAVGAASDEMKTGLEAAKATLKAAGIAVETRVISGQQETALGRLVDEVGFDMVVMGAYGHSRIRSLIIGSTTTEMIRSCKVPVVLVR